MKNTTAKNKIKKLKVGFYLWIKYTANGNKCQAKNAKSIF